MTLSSWSSLQVDPVNFWYMPHSVCTTESYSSFYLWWYKTGEWNDNVAGIDNKYIPKESIFRVWDILILAIVIIK